MISSNVVLTPEKLAETVEYFRKSPEGILSMDLETSGDNRGVPFCNSAPGSAWPPGGALPSSRSVILSGPR